MTDRSLKKLFDDLKQAIEQYGGRGPKKPERLSPMIRLPTKYKATKADGTRFREDDHRNTR